MSTLTVGTISEKVTDAGVAVDGVTLKDGELGTTASPVAIHSTSLNGGQFGRKNIIINGAMQIAQRATSATDKGASDGYFTLDRFKTSNGTTSAGRYTMSQSTVTDLEGFSNALKIDCTTADTSIDAGEALILQQNIEGFNLQQLKATSTTTRAMTLSFYAKSNASRAIATELRFSNGTNRQASKLHTIGTSWARYTFTVPSASSMQIDNDNSNEMQINFWIHGGSTFTGGTLSATFEAPNNANRAAGIGSIFASTDNTLEITGVQLEVGSVATPFEHRSFGEELGLCQRYYFENVGKNFGGIAPETNRVLVDGLFPQRMRTSPTLTAFSNDGTTGKCSRSLDNSNITVTSFNGQSADGIHQILGTFVQNAGYYLGVKADAEL